MASPLMSLPETNAPVLTNGVSSSVNGKSGGQSTNGSVRGSVMMENGQRHNDGDDRSPVSIIEEGKQKAKAVMAASGLSVQDTTDTSSTEQAKSPIANGVHGNGTTAQPSQTRKRSRDGVLIPTPAQTTPKPIAQRTREIKEKKLLEQYVYREQLHTAAICEDDKERMITMSAMTTERDAYGEAASRHPRAVLSAWFFGVGYAGYGNGVQDSGGRPPQVILPAQRKRPLGRKAKELRISKKDRETQAEQLDELVPIRLDIEYDKFRIRDTFTWNLHDRTVPLETFARHLVEDFGLSLPACEPLVQMVYHSMHEQIMDFHPHVHIDEAPLDPHLPYNAYKNDDMRFVVNLNITIGQNTLVDKFEWEINNPTNSPEEFAQQMTSDLSLSGEFCTAIAHSIREQSQLFTKSLYVTGHPFDGRPVEDHELLSAFCQSPMSSSFRPFQAAKDFTPYLYEMNEVELEKTELSLSREERRQKRSVNRRGGPALPDLKDRRRTNRTLLVSTVLPGAVESIENSRLLKRTATSNKARRGATRDAGDESEDTDSEDSSPDSPAMPGHLLSGTARTRGMRGAASAAQAAMRANLGRSATPELMESGHHPSRASARRVIRDDASSPEPQTSLIVKLKISRAKLQLLSRNQRARTKEMSQTPVPRPHSQNSSTPGVRGSMAPPTSAPQQNERSNATERAGHTSTPSKSNSTPNNPPTSKHGATSNLGRIDAVGPPGPDQPAVSEIL
jgi:SWI/SNF-related matrix-associated actin-dependent regulator of chromatin subfamily B protein 1